MNKKDRKSLLEAAELIAIREELFLCNAFKRTGNKNDILKDQTVRMFKPYRGAESWWGLITMHCHGGSEESRNARLLGIAFMLTMPEDMVDPKPPRFPKTKK